jgi:Xaa-Pro aminopeptidase
MDFNQLLDLIEKVDGTGLDLPGRDGRWLEFPRDEYARRYARAAVLMEELGLDALVCLQPVMLRWFTGFRTWLWVLPPLLPAAAILPRDPAGATLVDTVLERGGVRETTWLDRARLYGLSDDPVEAIAAAVDQLGLTSGRLGLELGRGQRPYISPADHQALLAALSGAEVVDASAPLAALRSLKSEREISRVREAVRITEIGYQAAFDALRPGITEVELTRVATHAMLDAGARPAIEPATLIFLSGAERYRQVVQPAVERAVRPGEQVWLDGGCVYEGYRADFMRSAVIGRLPEAAERWYQVAVESTEAALAAIGPGRPLGDAWSAAQRVLDNAGVGSATLIPAMTGHGIGLDHWEPPLLSQPGTPYSEVLARPGMVFSVEPTIVGPDGDDEWRSGLFVVEDQLVVTDTGVDVLTSSIPRELVRR